MKTKYFILAAVAGMTLASCSSDEFVGDLSPSPSQVTNDTEAINFGFDLTNMTRSDIYGNAAATLLGNHFYVTGTKGTEPESSPTTNLVFDNYLVRYTANTAGTTESNTANWEYVGVTPGTSPDDNYVKLGSYTAQTIKYWDYSQAQYDFFGFSTGTFKAVSSDTPGANEIGVTAMNYGASLANSGTAYTFTLPSVDAIKQAYITDITEVLQANYGKEVTLKFKNLGSKVRIALYETVPGYSVKDVIFYQWDGTTDFATGEGKVKGTTAALISANTNGIPTNGSIVVKFPHVGVNNSPQAESPETPKADYNKAIATVTSPASGATYEKTPTFGTLDNLVVKESAEDATTGEGATPYYLGRTLPTATFAGSSAASYYQTVFPVSSPDPLTLRVDYKLVSTDGSGEVIQVYGAKAVVPSTYTKWLPNYAYTYIFKISDNTNGWTVATGCDDTNQGLYPITFDAVVAEATDADAEQTTITTVAVPTITTYQQGHVYSAQNEYDNDGKDIYVQVMDNSAVPATLVTTLSATNSLLYAVDAAHAATATEAMVMDALQKRTTALDADNVTGRNGITLTKDDNINNAVTQIVNGVDDNPISITAGAAAMLDISELGAGTYAYVYDYTPAANTPKTATTVYQPITVTEDSPIGASGKKFSSIATSALATLAETEANFTSGNEDVDNDYIYFSVTTNGSSTKTYSFVSVDGKTKVPNGLLKCPVNSLAGNLDGATNAEANTIYFESYIRNNGSYAVKVIKIVD